METYASILNIGKTWNPFYRGYKRFFLQHPVESLSAIRDIRKSLSQLGVYHQRIQENNYHPDFVPWPRFYNQCFSTEPLRKYLWFVLRDLACSYLSRDGHRALRHVYDGPPSPPEPAVVIVPEVWKFTDGNGLYLL